MGGRHNNDGVVVQTILDEKMKELDELTLKIDAYQLIFLEEMNTIYASNLRPIFENKYNIYMNMMIVDLNKSMNNKYVTKGNDASIINIIFNYETQKVNVVTSTEFRLKNIYRTSLEKLDNKEPYIDINNLFFKYNSTDISNYFINNNDLKSISIPDKGVIHVLKKNMVQ